MHYLLPGNRRNQIAARLEKGETVIATDLAAEFAVSEDAIRRDLRALAEEGRCKRVYGGALPLSPISSSQADRLLKEPYKKRALARTASTLVQKGELIFLDSGSTNLALGAELADDRSLTIVTNSILIASALLGRKHSRVIMIGGTVDDDVGGCVDADAVLHVQRMNIDRCFLGACAVSSALGLCSFNHADAVFKRALLSRSQSVAALATIDKLETRAPHVIGSLELIDYLIVEHDTPPELSAKLAKAGPTILTAESLEFEGRVRNARKVGE
jgi:DeoR/GlpR family transcriptional regulator of sugar metabolism